MLCGARERTRILSVLAGTNWGQHEKILIFTYKNLICSVISYAAPFWIPIASTPIIQKLHVIQNNNLRIATSCPKRAVIDHLHSEIKGLEVSDSLSFLCAQYLDSRLKPNHPTYQIVNRPKVPRGKMHTLQSRFLFSIDHMFVESNTPWADIDQSKSLLHTETVQKTHSKPIPKHNSQQFKTTSSS